MAEKRLSNEKVLRLQQDIQLWAQRWKDPDRLADVKAESLEELLNSLEALLVAEEEFERQTEELLAARKLLELERQRCQDLFEFAPDGYLITDLTGKILEANRSAASLLNVPQSFLPGKMLPRFICMEERRDFRQRLNRLRHSVLALRPRMGSHFPEPLLGDGIQAGFEELEVRLQPRRKEPLDVSMRVALFQQEKSDCLRWSVHDISAQVATQKALQAREVLFRTLAETSSVAIFLIRKGKVEYANPAAARITNRTPSELLGMQFEFLIHPDDRLRFRMLTAAEDLPLSSPAAIQPFTPQELKLNRPEGETCWVDITAGLVIFEEQPAWMVAAYDITPRVQAENTHRELSRRILSLQEEERRRISRELHDQMGQSLTALTLGLKSLEAAVGDPTQLKTLRRLQAIAQELSQEIHRVAYELRPSALDDIGLASTLSNYLEEWSGQYGIEVDMESRLKPELALPPPTAMAIFRIVQEAFTNILRHAQATRASLILDQRPDQIRVIIEDNGIGFDPEAVTAQGPQPTGNLGLLGMEERAKLAGGSLQIESSPGRGTTLYLTFPISV